jgi:hypothetical protein
MGVVVDQAREHTFTFEIDDLRLRPGKRHNLLVMADGQELTLFDGNGGCIRISSVKRGEETTVQDQISEHELAPGKDG